MIISILPSNLSQTHAAYHLTITCFRNCIWKKNIRKWQWRLYFPPRLVFIYKKGCNLHWQEELKFPLLSAPLNYHRTTLVGVIAMELKSCKIQWEGKFIFKWPLTWGRDHLCCGDWYLSICSTLPILIFDLFPSLTKPNWPNTHRLDLVI